MDVTKPVSRRTALAAAASVGAAAALDSLAVRPVLARQSAANAVTLKFYINHGATDLPLFQQVINGFHAKFPNITIKMTNVPGNIDATVIPTLGASGSLPDVWYNRTYETADRANRGWTMNLTPFVQRDGAEINVKDFWPAEVVQETWKGQLHSLPYDFSDFGIYYNKTAFDKKKIKYPPADGNWTWNDLHNLAKEFVETSGGKQTKWGLDMSPLAWQWPTIGFVLAWGGKWISPDLRTFQVNTPEAVALFQMVQDMVYKTKVVPRGAALPAGFDPWQTGNEAMQVGGSWATLGYRPYIGKRFEWDVAPLPKGPTGKRPISPAGGAWSIAANTKHPNEAWEWAKYLSNKRSAEILLAEQIHNIPGRRSAVPVFNRVASTGKLPPAHVQVFGKYMGEAFSVPTVPYYDELAVITANAVQAIMSSQKPVKDTLAAWQTAGNAAIKKYTF